MFRWSILGALTFVALGAAARAEPLDKPVAGPKLVCFDYSVFSLEAGERIVDFSGSLEAIRIKIEGPFGSYDIGESGNFALQNGRKQLVSSMGQTSVYRIFGPEWRYAIFGPSEFTQGTDKPVLLLAGAALRNGAHARNIFRRFEVRAPRPAECAQAFTYGG